VWQLNFLWSFIFEEMISRIKLLKHLTGFESAINRERITEDRRWVHQEIRICFSQVCFKIKPIVIIPTLTCAKWDRSKGDVIFTMIAHFALRWSLHRFWLKPSTKLRIIKSIMQSLENGGPCREYRKVDC
jgi:hypothetical protein